MASNLLLDLINSMAAPKGHSKAAGGVVSSTARDLAASPIATIKQLTGQKVSPEEMDAATRGSETFFGGLTPGAPVAAEASTIAAGAKTALPAIKDAGKKIAQEGVDFGGIPQGAPRVAMHSEAPVDLPTNGSMGEMGTVAAPEPLPVIEPLGVRQKIIQKLNGLDNYQLSDKYKGNRPKMEAQDKAVMQNVVGGNTTAQVLDRTAAAKQKVWTQVEDSVKNLQGLNILDQADPTGVVTKPGISSKIKSQLQDLVDQGLIDQKLADTTLAKEEGKMMGGTLDPNPVIDGSKFLDIRTGANTLARKGLDASGNLKDTATPQQIINKAVADGYKEAMVGASPETQGLYQQYASLKRIEGMPNTLRNQSLGGSIPIIDKPIPGVGSARRLTAAALGGDPRVLVPGGIGVGVAGTKIAENVMQGNQGALDGSQNPQDNNNTNDNHTYSISDYTKSVNSPNYIPDVTQIIGADNKPIQLDTASYNAQNQTLTDDAVKLSQAAQLGIPSAKAGLDAIAKKQAALKEKHDTTQRLVDAHTGVTNKVENLLSVKQAISQADPVWLQALGGKANPLTTLRLAFDPAFAAWSTGIKSLQAQTGEDLSGVTSAGSKEVADKVIDQAVNRSINNYRQLIKDQGGTGIKNPTPTGAKKATTIVASPSVNPQTNVNIPQTAQPQMPNQAAMATFAE